MVIKLLIDALTETWGRYKTDGLTAVSIRIVLDKGRPPLRTVKHVAVCSGLSVGLVEKFDFSSGTSSRSTKLIHGGVRYLQKAIFNLDFEQVTRSSN